MARSIFYSSNSLDPGCEQLRPRATTVRDRRPAGLTSVVKEREFSAHASQEKGRFARTAK